MVLATGIVILPTEITLQVLKQLTYEDVLSCRRVSRDLSTLIDTCVDLQYQIQLGLHAMADNQHNAIPVPRKLELLQRYVAAWAQLSVERTAQSITTDVGFQVSLNGSVESRYNGDMDIVFMQLPSQIREEVASRTWTVPFMPEAALYAIDPHQDLLVLADYDISPMHDCISIKMFSLLTSQAHPSAAQARLASAWGDNDRAWEMKISGPYVGLLTSNVGTIARIIVWDWQRGVLVHNDEVPYSRSFVFLGDRYILATVSGTEFRGTTSDNAALYLIDFTARSRRWKFDLPPILGGGSCVGFELFCAPTSVAKTAPFYSSMKENLVLMRVDLRSFGTISLVFLSCSLVAFAENTIPSPNGHCNIPWSEWGPERCRVRQATHRGGIGRNASCGTRIVYSRMHDETHFELVVEDYNQRAIRCLQASPEGDMSFAKVVTESSTIDVNMSAKDSGLRPYYVTTSLPYRSVAVPWDLKCHHQVYMTEDAVVVSKREPHVTTVQCDIYYL